MRSCQTLAAEGLASATTATAAAANCISRDQEAGSVVYISSLLTVNPRWRSSVGMAVGAKDEVG